VGADGLPSLQCVREGYAEKMKQQDKEGCMIYGFMNVKKVAGNFHFAPGRTIERSNLHIHDLFSLMDRQFDFSHTINYLSFGQVVKGMRNPMDGLVTAINSPHSHLVQYFIKGMKCTFLRSPNLYPVFDEW
jgi:hypothetical protein